MKIMRLRLYAVRPNYFKILQFTALKKKHRVPKNKNKIASALRAESVNDSIFPKNINWLLFHGGPVV